jgi:hypothetical protein
MVLMDGENERLRQLAFAKQKKRKKTQTTSHPRHMTGAENLEELAWADWDAAMKGVFQEAINVFKAQRKKIDDHYKALAREDKLRQQREKAAEKLRLRMVKLAASEAEKAAKREERLRQRALKTAGALQRKQTKSMAAQARKGKAPARGPTTRHPRPPPFPVASSDSEDAALMEENEEEEEVTQTEIESGAELSADEAVAGPSQVPAEGVRRSSRLAKLL